VAVARWGKRKSLNHSTEFCAKCVIFVEIDGKTNVGGMRNGLKWRGGHLSIECLIFWGEILAGIAILVSEVSRKILLEHGLECD
jgi:hypothetical protein